MRNTTIELGDLAFANDRPMALFGGMNVPPGEEWSLLIWGIPQDEAHCKTTDSGDLIRPEANASYCLLGLSSITVQPDSVNIANVKLNPVPDGCAG